MKWWGCTPNSLTVQEQCVIVRDSSEGRSAQEEVEMRLNCYPGAGVLAGKRLTSGGCSKLRQLVNVQCLVEGAGAVGLQCHWY